MHKSGHPGYDDDSQYPDDEQVSTDLKMVADLSRKCDAFEGAHAALAEECGRLRAEIARELQAHCATIDRAEKAESTVETLRQTLQEVDRWFDGWCPTATCCAHTGKEVHERVRAALQPGTRE